ncbi:Glycosyl transferase group 1 family protein [Mucinivorans hirudinis]|uniref:Glycosyl transferase group 1 family protein n=1 Tax=Mucinivorans hirudinis TaxID=1433126 RepID=A0A060RDQ7_9BACT|nr:Glycosyl transferase group 1 family protein [Mucinivorans hirudinis]
MNKRVLYIGGFELPDKNAAAQRVVANAKILREVGYEVLFSGITHADDFRGEVEGFGYESIAYPRSLKDWFVYLTSIRFQKLIEEYRPSIIIAYNYPSVALNRLLKYCRKRGIKVVGDLTEWYSPTNPLKAADTSYRMKCVNKKLDGQIVISRLLADYYKRHKTLLLPPLVDLSQEKWSSVDSANRGENVRLVYVGSPGAGWKDRLDLIVDFVVNQELVNKVSLIIIGITKKQFETTFQREEKEIKNVEFMGRLPHLESIDILKKSDFQIFIRSNTRVNNAGFPTKFVEAISAGIPVITNLTSNLNDYLIDGVNGFIVETTTDKSLEEGLERAIKCSRSQIEQMKRYCLESKIFDCLNYTADVSAFLNGLDSSNN